MADDLETGQRRRRRQTALTRKAPADARERATVEDTRPHWRKLILTGFLHLPISRIGACMRRYRQLEKASPGEVEEYQRRRLLALLRHCRRHVPYYRRLIDARGVRLDDDFTSSELRKLPILTKQTVRKEFRNLHSDDGHTRGVFRNSSGGSTGEPLTFLQDRHYYTASVVAAKFMYNELLGKKAGEREVNLWGSERDVRRGTLGVRQRALNFLYNRRLLNFYTVDDEKLARFLEAINSFRPVSIWAYVQSLDLLAKFIRRNGLAVHSPRLIICTAGTLHEGVRQRAQEVFGCPVYNQYGCREVGTIAFEMQDQDGLRGLPYLNVTEVVGGKVVVTSLTNYSMPLLRYELGDTAEPWTGSRDERYGCRQKVFKAITGRSHSHFVKKDGGLVYGGYFSHQFFFLDWVRQFQVVQDRLDHVTCHIVPDADPPPADVVRIRENIRQAMGADCRVDFDYADAIQPSASGKHLYTISHVRP